MLFTFEYSGISKKYNEIYGSKLVTPEEKKLTFVIMKKLTRQSKSRMYVTSGVL